MRCKFAKPNGERCRANAIKNSDYCFMHDPNKIQERALAVKKGGLAPKKFLLNNQDEVALETAQDAKRFLAMVINGVWQGKIPATPVANTLGFLIRCFLDAYEKADIEMRLDEIEKRIEKGGL